MRVNESKAVVVSGEPVMASLVTSSHVMILVPVVVFLIVAAMAALLGLHHRQVSERISVDISRQSRDGSDDDGD